MIREIAVVSAALLCLTCGAHAQGYPYPGPPMWRQMDGDYGPPPGVLMPDGPYGPGSPYNAPGMDNMDGPPQPWMQSAPPVPRQAPGGMSDPDEDDFVLIQWGGEFGSPYPPYGGVPPTWYGADPRDMYGTLPAGRQGDYPGYWNAYPQPGAGQPQYPTTPMSPYESAPGGYGGDDDE